MISEQPTSASLPSPAPLAELQCAYWASGAYFAAVEVDLFTHLAAAAATPEELAARMGLAARPARLLLTACVPLGLVEKRDGRFHNTPMANAYLVQGRPTYIGALPRVLGRRAWAAWGELAEAVRNNAPVRGSFDEDPELPRIFAEATHTLRMLTSARGLAEAHDFSSHRLVLDVGGSSGAFVIQAIRRYPGLRAMVFDLPPACAVAERMIREAGVADRITLHPGDFRTDPLPEGADVVLLSLVVNTQPDDEAERLLRKVHAALPPGGVVLIHEPLLDDDETGPKGVALFSLQMLAITHGRARSRAEYRALLSSLGFEVVGIRPLAGDFSLLTARRP